MLRFLIALGRLYGMEMYVDKATATRTSRQPSPVQNLIDQTPLKNVKYFNQLVA